MKMQTSGSQEDKFSSPRSPMPTIIVALIALVVGGCLSLLIVNRLLQAQLEVYSSSDSMAAAATILDFMDDLLPLYLLCASVLLLLVLFAATMWAWARTESRFLRYGLLILIILGVAFIVGIFFLGSSSTVQIPPPSYPTPTAVPN